MPRYTENDVTVPVDTSRPMVTIIRACELAGVSRRTIYTWMSSGKVQYVRTTGGAVRIYADTLWRKQTGDI